MTDWIYGRNSVYETLRAQRRSLFVLRIAKELKGNERLNRILSLAKDQKVSIEQVNREALDKFGGNHQGIAISAGDYPYSDLGEMLTKAKDKSEIPFFLLLDTLKDPQNLGTLLRTSEAVGVHGVILPARRTAKVTPAVVNASSGASEHMLIAQQNLAQAITFLKEEGIWVLGLEGGEKSEDIGQVNLKGSLAIVVGSEGEGMRRLVKESCDVLMKLPMQGNIESLNAAVAGSIALYLAKQTRDSIR